MRKLISDIKPYAWGDTYSISNFLGVENSEGTPQAELWVGTHPLSPSKFEDGSSLNEVIRLPFLVKLLAAASPLSIQVHPSREEAIEGFQREEAAGVPLEAAERNYKDANHKPEMIIALSEEFHALVGFKENKDIAGLVKSLLSFAKGDVTGLLYVLNYANSVSENPRGFDVLAKEILSSDLGIRIAEEITSNLAAGSPIPGAVSEATSRDNLSGELKNLQLAAEYYPNDRGLALALLMNYRVLKKGEALYLPANEIHAYMRGFGLEVMAESDNVLRCGLTPKHIDVKELGKLLSTQQSEYAKLEPWEVGSFKVWNPISDFQVMLAIKDAEVVAENTSILFIAAENEALQVGFPNLRKGEFYLVEQGEHLIVPTGCYLISTSV